MRDVLLVVGKLNAKIVDQIHELRSNGLTIRAIARTLNVSVNAVNRHVKPTKIQLCTGCDQPGHKRNTCPDGPWPEVGNPQSDAYYRRHKLSGLCVRCPKLAEPDHNECSECREKIQKTRSNLFRDRDSNAEKQLQRLPVCQLAYPGM